MKTRRTRDETRQLLLQEGSRLLLTEGMRGAPDIRLKDVCESLNERTGIRITPGSVYERIWRDQREYQLSVLAEVLSGYDAGEISKALQTAAESIVDADTRDDAARSEAKAKYCRSAADALVDATLGSRLWQIWIAVWGAVASTPELQDDEKVGPVIEAGYEAATDAIASAVSGVFRDLGYRLVPGLSEYQLGVAIGSLVEGLALRLRYDTDHTRELATTHDGIEDPRGLLAVSFEAIVDRFYAVPGPI